MLQKSAAGSEKTDHISLTGMPTCVAALAPESDLESLTYPAPVLAGSSAKQIQIQDYTRAKDHIRQHSCAPSPVSTWAPPRSPISFVAKPEIIHNPLNDQRNGSLRETPYTEKNISRYLSSLEDPGGRFQDPDKASSRDHSMRSPQHSHHTTVTYDEDVDLDDDSNDQDDPKRHAVWILVCR